MDIDQILKEASESGNVSKYSLRSVDSLEEDVRQSLIKMVERGGKSSSELGKALVAKEFPREIVDQMITRFIEVSLIDDFALARDLVELAVTRKAKAKSVIARELAEKGLPKEAIDAALSGIDQDSELEAAKTIAEKRIRQLLKLEPEVRQRRLAGFLSRKGYSNSVVWSAVRYATEQVS
ncbi:MAG: regulatory protein RecX [Micrococcales bacterium]|nr:regulatory protein RecX [Actinomycetota bacterium]NCA07655.1 regulatory protein RecX [Micrococcales bacterium]